MFAYSRLSRQILARTCYADRTADVTEQTDDGLPLVLYGDTDSIVTTTNGLRRLEEAGLISPDIRGYEPLEKNLYFSIQQEMSSCFSVFVNLKTYMLSNLQETKVRLKGHAAFRLGASSCLRHNRFPASSCWNCSCINTGVYRHFCHCCLASVWTKIRDSDLSSHVFTFDRPSVLPVHLLLALKNAQIRVTYDRLNRVLSQQRSNQDRFSVRKIVLEESKLQTLKKVTVCLKVYCFGLFFTIRLTEKTYGRMHVQDGGERLKVEIRMEVEYVCYRAVRIRKNDQFV